MELNNLTLAEARRLLDQKKISSRQLTEYYLDRLKKYDNQLASCLLINQEPALHQADEADRRMASGEVTGVLGIPYLAKDNILTKLIKTTAASKMLADYVAPYDATVIARLQQAGAVLLGKTNLDEFAHGSSTENSFFGVTKNPYDLSRVPGGSSGGSAAAVAADLCIFALGSDTGGSVRHPASLSGVVGYKPSYGAVSRHGLIAMASSTDVIGVLSKTADDAAEVLKIIAGEDDFDATAKRPLTCNNKAEIDWPSLKIGWPAEYLAAGLNSEVLDSLNQVKDFFQERGARIVPVSLPSTKYGVAVYYVITSVELSSNLARFDGLRYGYRQAAENLAETYLVNRGQGFGLEPKRRVMLGTYILNAGQEHSYYDQAQQVRRWISYDFAQAFQKVDFLLTPTVPQPAFKIGQKIDNPLSLYLEDVLLTPASLAGVPAVSWPTGWSREGLPIGSQLIGPIGRDYDLLTLTQAIQSALTGSRRPLAWEK